MAAFMRGTVLTDLSTSSVPDHLKGTLLGMEHSIFALAGTITPSLGTSLLASIGLTGLVALGSVVEILDAFTWLFLAFPCIDRVVRGAKLSEDSPPEQEKKTK